MTTTTLTRPALGSAPRPAVIYARISDDQTGEELGVERQETDCRALAARLGLEVAEVFIDNDISAIKGKVRPDFERLLTEHGGRPVLVFHTDRLVRLTPELERVIEAGLTVHAVTAGTVDLSNPAGRAVARTVVAWAQYEGEQKALRQQSAHVQMADSGKPWGPAPFGYVKVGGGKGQPRAWEVDPTRAPLVRAAYLDVLSGRSLSAIAAEWNAAGVRTQPTKKARPEGSLWRQATVSQMLRNPSYAGLRYHGREDKSGRPDIVGKGLWEPIVTEGTWLSVVALLTDPTRNSGGSATATWLATGQAYCGHCGATVRKGQRSTDKAAFYRCNASAHLGRSAALVDSTVAALVVARLAQPDALGAPEGDEAANAAREEAADLRARLVALSTDYVDGYLTREQMLTGTDRARAALTMVERRTRKADLHVLAGLVPDDTEEDRAGYVAAAWEAAPMHLRRKAMALLADWWILPARGTGEVVPADALVLEGQTWNPMTRAMTTGPVVALRWR